MSRRSLRTGLWAAQLVAVFSLLGAAQPARAQFHLPKGLQKYAQKAEDIHKSMTITVDQEKDIGREVAAKLIGYYHLYNNPALAQYVNLVGETVAAQSPRQDIQYHFAILDSDDINAVSAPGGFIFITRGALALCDDESELAGVLAHEVAHVTDKHVVKVIERDKGMAAGFQEASTHMQSDKYKQMLQNMSKNVLVNLLDHGLAPADEYDADEKGVMFAHAAGYPADGLERFLIKMGEATKGNEVPYWSKTHPPVADRNTRIQQEITSQGWQDQNRPRLAERFEMVVAALKPKS
jgi:predicted Zn-dependent protease